MPETLEIKSIFLPSLISSVFTKIKYLIQENFKLPVLNEFINFRRF